ncbi:hypothetical protein SLA2020_034980 [Shorea laevis]
MQPPVVGHLLWSEGPVDCFHDGARLEQHGQGRARTVWCAGRLELAMNLVDHVGCYQWEKEKKEGAPN